MNAGVRAWPNSIGSQKGLLTGFCEHGSGLTRHIKKQVALIMLIIALQFDVSTSFNM